MKHQYRFRDNTGWRRCGRRATESAKRFGISMLSTIPDGRLAGSQVSCLMRSIMNCLFFERKHSKEIYYCTLHILQITSLNTLWQSPHAFTYNNDCTFFVYQVIYLVHQFFYVPMSWNSNIGSHVLLRNAT